MSWNAYRMVRSWLGDPGRFQVVAYGFAFVLGAVTLAVAPIVIGR